MTVDLRCERDWDDFDRFITAIGVSRLLIWFLEFGHTTTTTTYFSCTLPCSSMNRSYIIALPVLSSMMQ